MLTKLATSPMFLSPIVRMVTVVGVVLGIFCTGAVSIVLGSLFGTAMGYVVDVVGGISKAKIEETAEVKAHN